MSGENAGSRSVLCTGCVNFPFSPLATFNSVSPIGPCVDCPSGTTSHLPSDDHEINLEREYVCKATGVATSAIFCSEPPTKEEVSKTSARPFRVMRIKAIDRPSGDQAGLKSGRGSSVRRTGVSTSICLM